MKKFCIHREFILPAICIGICAYFFVKAGAYEKSLQTFPRMMAVACTLCFVPVLRNAFRLNKEAVEKIKNGETPEDVITWDNLKYPLITWSTLIVYGIGIVYIGYFVTTAVFMFALMWYQGYKNITRILIIISSTEILIYLIFVRWLQVRTPHGILY